MIGSGVDSPRMSEIDHEIASQPSCWRRAGALAAALTDALPAPGSRVAVIGCGTSLYMAQAYAALREVAGAGETDAFPASELPRSRSYDAVVAISRSGTTTEVVWALDAVSSRTVTHAIVGVSGTPVDVAAQHTIVLDFADESSVVQTRFATTALVLLRAALGHDVANLVGDAERALAAPLPVDLDEVEAFAFLGRGWTIGLANEAALKLCEAALYRTVAFPALEYRHGPIALAGPGTAVWPLGAVDDALLADVRATGATVVDPAVGDPLAALVLVQRVAVEAARVRGLDPDRPRNLTRSVILP